MLAALVIATKIMKIFIFRLVLVFGMNFVGEMKNYEIDFILWIT